ncbi:hypothetical protein NDU88_006404 [Pleurodeles waltl]|uniref:Uncharacterized protein n=1 Tax=Pleurodeles waltl TaxID=8319 RepID=A0AAV7TE29_PLEWA|nr:hypothetical protein NDU88_006404 [Pleurodeles waltl]
MMRLGAGGLAMGVEPFPCAGGDAAFPTLRCQASPSRTSVFLSQPWREVKHRSSPQHSGSTPTTALPPPPLRGE